MPEMEATKSRTSFLSLSAELRNRIYEEVLQTNNRTRTVKISSAYGRRDHMTLPASTQVSQQVRGETLPMYYSNKYFQFWLGKQQRMNEVEQWLKSIGPKQAAMVKDLCVMTDFTKSEWMEEADDALAERGTTAGNPQDMLRDEDSFRAWGLDQLTKAHIYISFLQEEESGILQGLHFEAGRAVCVNED